MFHVAKCVPLVVCCFRCMFVLFGGVCVAFVCCVVGLSLVLYVLTV